jgi:NADH-dependent peroxiredoxin subunit F
MLEQSMKDQVRQIFANLSSNFTFKVVVSDSHPQRKDISELIADVASCSDKLDYEIQEGEGLSFSIKIEGGNDPDILFRAVPTGHEFTTLLLAILNMDGTGKNLPDETTIKRIKALKGKITLTSYISLTCTNCPDVVQALNLLAIYNPDIRHEIVDGVIHKEEVESLNIQAVPSVYAVGKPLHTGRSTLGELLEKLEKQVGTEFQSKSTERKDYDVIVVGGGPAGVSSAIYSARKGFSVAIVADKIGGQVSETVDIENMISVSKTTGSELSANLRLHMNEYPIDVLENRMVHKSDIVDGIKHIYTTSGELLTAPALIIATGANWRKLNIPGESEYIGSGVAFCTHCDGPFYKNKRVVVIGGGNSGLEAAIDLSSIATEVTVLEFLDELKGDKILQDRLLVTPNVKIITNVETLSIDGDGSKVVGIQTKDRNTGKIISMDVDGVFVQIGLTANSKVFENIVKTNGIGEIEVDAHCRTKNPGIYAAGDVTEVPYKQIVIAMGEGSKAALSAFEDTIKGRLLEEKAELVAS